MFSRFSFLPTLGREPLQSGYLAGSSEVLNGRAQGKLRKFQAMGASYLNLSGFKNLIGLLGQVVETPFRPKSFAVLKTFSV